MNERRLSDLPGYQPAGMVDSLDYYLSEKMGQFGSGASAYLSDTALLGGGLSIDPGLVEHLAAQGRQEVINQQGVAPYVAGLARRLVAACVDRTIVTRPADETALTTLFRDEYGVDLAPYMQQSTNKLGITGIADKSGAAVIGLNYMAIREARGNTFWQLTVDGQYGFVNMYCVRHDFDTLPLQGSGNIAFIPGVEEALTADTAFIENRANRDI